MPFDQDLDARIVETVSGWNTTKKSMFGGTCHLLNGNMFCGVYREFLILRLGEQVASEALQVPFVQPFAVTGRPMKGWVMVDPRGTQDDNLPFWLSKARDFVETLPPRET